MGLSIWGFGVSWKGMVLTNKVFSGVVRHIGKWFEFGSRVVSVVDVYN
jgi:hypothetical protein